MSPSSGRTALLEASWLVGGQCDHALPDFQHGAALALLTHEGAGFPLLAAGEGDPGQAAEAPARIAARPQRRDQPAGAAEDLQGVAPLTARGDDDLDPVAVAFDGDRDGLVEKRAFVDFLLGLKSAEDKIDVLFDV